MEFFAAKKCAVNNDAVHGSPGIRARILRQDGEVGGCVVDKNRHRTKRCFDLIKGRVDLVGISNVTLSFGASSPHRFNRRDARCSVLSVARHDANRTACSSKLHGDRSTKPSSPTSHERYLAVEGIASQHRCSFIGRRGKGHCYLPSNSTGCLAALAA